MPTLSIERRASRPMRRQYDPDQGHRMRKLVRLEQEKGIGFRDFILDVANARSYTQADIAAWWGVTEHTVGNWLEIHGFVQYIVYKEEKPSSRDYKKEKSRPLNG